MHKVTVPQIKKESNRNFTKERLAESAKVYGKSPYGEHLKEVSEGRVRY